ncbi:LysM domain-containing protein [Streptosporangium subroseum]|uniref:LysM domain-containing protein n=1 Tax=Streptosporangium subroseum TaxID=106412 RepID=A0A239FD46_9ACTN|nr:LysM peptidoglycan-binding domain-containing protein [Streptosporangium subroseum]SNS54960.1 LysM domain-containing protein [Streptosporangium subroseum]
MVAALALITLGGLWIGGRIDAASAGERSGHEGLPWVVVHEGDTLREIADAATREVDPGRVARRIMDLNGLSGSVLQPGTRLYLPDGLAP